MCIFVTLNSLYSYEIFPCYNISSIFVRMYHSCSIFPFDVTKIRIWEKMYHLLKMNKKKNSNLFWIYLKKCVTISSWTLNIPSPVNVKNRPLRFSEYMTRKQYMSQIKPLSFCKFWIKNSISFEKESFFLKFYAQKHSLLYEIVEFDFGSLIFLRFRGHKNETLFSVDFILHCQKSKTKI